MSRKKVNIAVMQASVREHEHQLRFHLQRPIVKFFKNLYTESQTKADNTDRSDDADDLLLFTGQLDLVKDWNKKTTEEIITLLLSWVQNRNFKIAQCIKTVITARTMLLVSMGDSECGTRVRIEIPDTTTFMHLILMNVATELLDYPALMRSGSDHVATREQVAVLYDIVRVAIDDTIVDHVSSASVFDYLDRAMAVDSFDADEEEEEEEDEDVHDPIRAMIRDSFDPDDEPAPAASIADPAPIEVDRTFDE